MNMNLKNKISDLPTPVVFFVSILVFSFTASATVAMNAVASKKIIESTGELMRSLGDENLVVSDESSGQPIRLSYSENSETREYSLSVRGGMGNMMMNGVLDSRMFMQQYANIFDLWGQETPETRLVMATRKLFKVFSEFAHAKGLFHGGRLTIQIGLGEDDQELVTFSSIRHVDGSKSLSRIRCTANLDTPNANGFRQVLADDATCQTGP